MLDLIVEEIIHLNRTDFINEQDEEDDDIDYEEYEDNGLFDDCLIEKEI